MLNLFMRLADCVFSVGCCRFHIFHAVAQLQEQINLALIESLGSLERELEPFLQMLRPHPNLLPVVFSITNQRLGNRNNSTAYRSQERDPAVMSEFAGNREDRAAEFTAECHRRSGNNRMLDQYSPSEPFRKLLLLMGAESNGSPEPCCLPVAIPVHDFRITKHRDRRIPREEPTFQQLQFVWIPEVVLVSESNDLSTAQPDSLLEVRGRTQVGVVAEEQHRERNSLCEVLDDLGSVIGGVVIADDQFVGNPRLRGDAIQLLGDKLRAVECTHRY